MQKGRRRLQHERVLLQRVRPQPEQGGLQQLVDQRVLEAASSGPDNGDLVHVEAASIR